MFYSLKGIVRYYEENMIAVDCGGICFACNTTANTLKKTAAVGDEVMLYTYLAVREDAMDLFGFAEKSELDCFKLLISVSGVGPKAAIAILSQMSPEHLASAIAVGDVKSITRAQGVGPKLAQRVVLELKDKMKIDLENIADTDPGGDFTPGGGNVSEAVSALVQLGYSKTEAVKALNGSSEGDSVENLIKYALKKLSLQ